MWIPADGEIKRETKAKGKLRICTRNIVFEPDDVRQAILKWPLRQCPAKPQSLLTQKDIPFAAEITEAVSADGKPKDAFVFQPLLVIRAKDGGSAVPLDVRPYPVPAVKSTRAGEATEGGGTPSKPKLAKAKSFLSGKGNDEPSTPVDPSSSFLPTRTTVSVVLTHTSLATMLPTLQQLWEIQQACADAATGKERARIQPLIDARLSGPFDPSLLSDYREKMLLPNSPAAYTAERVFPLVSMPGRMQLTATGLYFMPVAVNNIAGSDPVFKWKHKDIGRVQRRTRLQRETGLEITLAEDALGASGTSSDLIAAGLAGSTSSRYARRVFLSFSTAAIRNTVYKALLKQLRDRTGKSSTAAGAEMSDEYDDTLGDYSKEKLQDMSSAWRSGSVSNYDYLTFLNDYAGRTLVDFSQYPVFPWVIADYSSSALDLDNPASFRDLTKPVGALNEQRLKSFRQRYEQMPVGAEAKEQGFDPPFLYGTHYSTPGYVLYFLVRSLPEHMIKLQAGRFDAPDRLFHDICSTWAGVTGINSDLKELIPEFYDSDGSFLLLPDGLNLGVRQSGKRVGDVSLPAWAYDHGDFVDQCRNALESPCASAQLHHWIDLIFGYKQKGEQAIANDNLFHYLTYEGAVDVEALSDPDSRAAMQSQIAEFGQCPKQLFTAPHPAKKVDLPAPSLLPSMQAVVPGRGAAAVSTLALEPSSPPAAVVQETTRALAFGSSSAATEEGELEEGEISHDAAANANKALLTPSLTVRKKRSKGVRQPGMAWAHLDAWALSDVLTHPPSAQMSAAGMTAVTSLLPLDKFPDVFLRTGTDGCVAVHSLASPDAGTSTLACAITPSALTAGADGQISTALLVHTAITGQNGALPLRCSCAIPSTAVSTCAVAGLDGRVYVLQQDDSRQIRALGAVQMAEAGILCMTVVQLQPTGDPEDYSDLQTFRDLSSAAPLLCLAGTTEGSVHASLFTLQGASVVAGKAVVISKRSGHSITSVACKITSGGVCRVAVGDSTGRLWTVDLACVTERSAPSQSECSRRGLVLVPAPTMLSGSSSSPRSCGLVYTHESAGVCESVLAEGLARLELSSPGSGAIQGASGVTSIHWFSLKQPQAEDEAMPSAVPTGSAGHDNDSEEEGGAAVPAEGPSAPAILVTTTSGQVGVLYAPDADLEAEGADPDNGALTLCGVQYTGDVLRAAVIPVCDGRRGWLVACTNTALKAWRLRGLLTGAAKALLAGFEAGGVEYTVPAPLSTATSDPPVTFPPPPDGVSTPHLQTPGGLPSTGSSGSASTPMFRAGSSRSLGAPPPAPVMVTSCAVVHGTAGPSLVAGTSAGSVLVYADE